MSRRFIAGATCPGCGAIDKIVVIDGGGKKIRECVKCGFTEAFGDAVKPQIEVRTITIQPSGPQFPDSTDK